jgi:hypothetical protein
MLSIKEKDIQGYLLNYFKAKNIQAIAEYKIPLEGNKDRIDIFLVDRNIIIEIKKASEYKGAVGQLIAYQNCMVQAGHHPPALILCLFGVHHTPRETVLSVCNAHNIRLLYCAVQIELQDLTNKTILN